MNRDDAFAKMVTLLSPYLVRGLVNTGNPMPKVKVILEEVRAAAHAEGYATGAEEAHERGYNEGYEQAQFTVADWYKP